MSSGFHDNANGRTHPNTRTTTPSHVDVDEQHEMSVSVKMLSLPLELDDRVRAPHSSSAPPYRHADHRAPASRREGGTSGGERYNPGGMSACQLRFQEAGVVSEAISHSKGQLITPWEHASDTRQRTWTRCAEPPPRLAAMQVCALQSLPKIEKLETVGIFPIRCIVNRFIIHVQQHCCTLKVRRWMFR